MPEGIYTQQSFIGGMDMLADDSRLEQNKYRVGFNLRNRYDELNLIQSSVEDTKVPYGIKQEHTSIGEYQLIFVSGKAYYKHYTDTNWLQVDGFQMSAGVKRLWTEQIPVTLTNYLRLAASSEDGRANSRGSVSLINVSGAAQGNIPGVLVQDNVLQPRLIFIGENGVPTSRITQSFEEWSITFTNEKNTTVAPDGDKREYVPIGNAMSYVDGILWIVSMDFNTLYRSVSGRPLDFVVNVTNKLATTTTTPAYTQRGGGDASTTSYNVGVGGIKCVRGMSDGSLFVAAGNANFLVSKDKSNIAPMEFGEWTFVRKFLFNAVCMSDRAILDSTGDTKFIDLGGVRSFNAIKQSQGTEGRNSVFSSRIKAAFSVANRNNSSVATILQEPDYSAAVLFDDYEIYAVNTIFGPALAIYDTINACWSSFDISQTGGKKIKQLTKIELEAQTLYAITEDDKLFQLYASSGTDLASFRTIGLCANQNAQFTDQRTTNPGLEVQLRSTRLILNKITKDCECSLTPYVNNRSTPVGTLTKNIKYSPPKSPSATLVTLADVDTQLENILFSTPDCNQGWKAFGFISWSGGAIIQFSFEFNTITPMNSLNSQR